MFLLEVKPCRLRLRGDIIKNVSFSLKEATSHIRLGSNGSGKTTLISAIMGLPGYEVVSGKIICRGIDITNKGPDERAQLGMVVSFQNPPEVTGALNKLMIRLRSPPITCASDQSATYRCTLLLTARVKIHV